MAIAFKVDSASSVSSETEENLVEMLLERARESRGPAAQVKTSSGWKDVSWPELLAQVKAVSNGLVGWGVKPGDRVAIFANTSLTWCVVDLAIHAAKAISVPIYASNTPEEVRYILDNSGAVLLFVDDDEPTPKQAGRLTRANLKLAQTAVKQVVLFQGASASALSLEGLIEKGRDLTDFEERARAIGRDDLSHFLYTSGTTGDPKGVILTHGNWAFEGTSLRRMGVMQPGDAVLLFLPMAHSFAQAAKSAWLAMGFKMVFAESVEKVVANLGETKPTILPTVPRVLEKVFSAVNGSATSAPGVKGQLGRWAFRLFDEYVAAKEKGQSYDSLGWALAKRLVFKKVRAALDEKLGGRMRIFISGGAPLPKKIGYFFDLLGFTVCEGYGLTETAAGATLNRPEAVRIGTVGQAFPTVELKIADDGEILVRGPNVMKGYYRNQAATDEVLEPDGFFHTGDIGELDEKGTLRITDRKKDLIKTSGGKYCAPQNLENALKAHGIVSNSMVHGDNRPYLTVLICVSEENARKVVAEQAGATMSYAELSKAPELLAAVKKAVDAVNAELPPYSTLKRFSLVDHDFSQETGELTPTLKVRRKICTQKYQAALDAMYERAAHE
jgi:long-chain acyl-CoA synthetase